MFADFTKSKARKFEKVNLSEVLKKSIQLYKNHSDTTFIFTDDPAQSCFTAAYEKDLLRVFNNLIKNAIQSMEGISDHRVEIKLFTAEQNHIVEFIDNGKGISEEELDKIFIPFFTTKEHGSGIGLSLSRQIMRIHKGSISATSVPGKHTSFYLKF